MIGPAAGLVAVLALAAGVAMAGDNITDAQIKSYAARPFDKRAKMFKHEVLGFHHGVKVLVDYPCGDICPDYTRRIIHYEVGPGPGCARIGGAEVLETVPVADAATRKPFCEPKVLAKPKR